MSSLSSLSSYLDELLLEPLEVEEDFEPPLDECEVSVALLFDDSAFVDEPEFELVLVELFFLVATVVFLTVAFTVVPFDEEDAEVSFEVPSTTTTSSMTGAGSADTSVEGAAVSVMPTSFAARDVVASPTVASARA